MLSITTRGFVNALTNSAIGSMADVPKDLLDQIKELERIFTVDTAKLKEVTNHFVKELEKGRSQGPDVSVGLLTFRKVSALKVEQLFVMLYSSCYVKANFH